MESHVADRFEVVLDVVKTCPAYLNKSLHKRQQYFLIFNCGYFEEGIHDELILLWDLEVPCHVWSHPLECRYSKLRYIRLVLLEVSENC